MAATRATWSDVAADLATAREETAKASRKHAALLSGDPPPGDAAAREDRELAVGKHLHDAYCAVEKALERLVEEFDGALPTSRSWHMDLIERAARAIEGTRPAILGPETRAGLRRLAAFRHAYRHQYGGFAYDLAAPNVALADRAVPRAASEAEAFARAVGLIPPGGSP